MEKINVAEILKNCPKGTKLYSLVHGEVELTSVVNEYILCKPSYLNHELSFSSDGRWVKNQGECILFPSKENRDWDKFNSFKDGDIVFYNDTISIFKEWGDDTLFRAYVCTYLYVDVLDPNVPLFGKSIKKETRFATEEEKQKLFDVIKANGYKWNPKTKILEKLIEPQFKVGDRIRFKTHIRQGNAVTEIKDTYYILDNELALPFTSQYLYELVPNKFDISTLIPFESRVLVRNVLVRNIGDWKPAFWRYYSKDYTHPFVVDGGNAFAQCIPYEGNEHLLGTTDDCDDFYKNW